MVIGGERQTDGHEDRIHRMIVKDMCVEIKYMKRIWSGERGRGRERGGKVSNCAKMG